MSKRPNSTQLVDQLDDLIASLQVAKQVVPHLAEQARLESKELSGDLPTAGQRCGNDHCDGRPHDGLGQHPADYSGEVAPGWPYSDPTGETVVNHRSPQGVNPGRDLEYMARWYGDVTDLVGSTRMILNQAPAVTLAVVAGRKPTDGRTQEEHDQRRFVRAVSGSRCEIGEDHDPTEPPFGPGQLRGGLCNRHRMAFARWADRNSAGLFGMARADMLTRWRAETWPEKWGDTRNTVDESAYKSLRRVA